MAVTEAGDLYERAFIRGTRQLMMANSRTLKALAASAMNPNGTTTNWNAFLETFTATEARMSTNYHAFTNSALRRISEVDRTPALKLVEPSLKEFNKTKALIDAQIRGVYNLQTQYRQKQLTATEPVDLTTQEYDSVLNNMVNGGLERILANGRSWVDDNAQSPDNIQPSEDIKSRIRYVRQAEGPRTCMFCMMLVGRGPVYLTEESSNFQTHPRCDCVGVPASEGWSFSQPEFDKLNTWYMQHYGRMLQQPDYGNYLLHSSVAFRDEMARQGYLEYDKLRHPTYTYTNSKGEKSRAYYGTPTKKSNGQTINVRENVQDLKLSSKFYEDLKKGNLEIQQLMREYNPSGKTLGLPIGNRTVKDAFDEIIKGM